MKFIVAAFILLGALFSVSAQAAPASPAAIDTHAVLNGSVEKVQWGGCGWGGGGCGGWGGGWGGGGCGYRPCWRPCGYYGYGCGYRWWGPRPYWSGWGYRPWGGGGWGYRPGWGW